MDLFRLLSAGAALVDEVNNSSDSQAGPSGGVHDVLRVLRPDGMGSTIGVMANIVTNPKQLKRFVELMETSDFPAFARALQPGADLQPDFFPKWILRAGGYFPKFAQVLSVRADLIHSREVLEQLGRCIEDVPAKPRGAVKQHLMRLGWNSNICNGVGGNLNAGSVAQINELTMPDGTIAVVKVAWPDTREKMETDFRLFVHARQIVAALRLDDDAARVIPSLFKAVAKSEASVLQEFDMEAEARALAMAKSLCTRRGEWYHAYQIWLEQAEATLVRAPLRISQLALQFVGQMRTSGGRVQVPEALPGSVSQSAFAMSLAGGQSLHTLISGCEAEQQTAISVIIGLVVPFIGWLLLCKSTSHLAHVDPHLGNFRWEANSQTLWALDWGSNVKLPAEKRCALCALISGIALGVDDEIVADAARSLGVRSHSSSELARLMRGLLNATAHTAAQDALSDAAMDGVLDSVSDDMAPVVRCLATLGGIMKEVQRLLNEEGHGNVELSVASLWLPFAAMGLRV